MNQMETMTALTGVFFALLLAALAVSPILIRAYLDLRAQKQQGEQDDPSGLLASYRPPVPFNFPPTSLRELSTDNGDEGRAEQQAASSLLEAYPPPVPFNYPRMLSRRRPDKK
jgi:hypothetical protein